MTAPRLLLLAALAMTWPAAHGGIGCSPLPYPEGSQWTVVADDMVFNGVPMAAWELRWREPPDKLRAYYRSYWEARGQRVDQSATGDWITVATQDGQCFYTVQTQTAQGGGSHALIGATRAPASAAPPNLGAGFPMPAGSQVANDIRHRDGLRKARTLMLGNTLSPEGNAAYFRNALAGEGWTLAGERVVGSNNGPSRLLLWKRGAEEASMTIAKGGTGSAVVINIVDKP